MSDLGPDARALLDAARGGHDPDPGARTRMRAAVLRRVGATAAAVTTVAATTATSGATTSATFGGALLAKALVVVAVATGGVAVAHRVTSKQPSAVVATPPSATIVSPQPILPILPILPIMPLVPSVAVVPDEPPPVVSAEPPAAAVVKKAAVVAPLKTSTLSDELASLRSAHEALRAGRPAEALALVDAMHGKTLGEERAATRALALCALGRADATTHAAKFVTDHPTSPLAARVRAACAIP